LLLFNIQQQRSKNYANQHSRNARYSFLWVSIKWYKSTAYSKYLFFFVNHFLANQQFVEELHQINDSKRQRLLEISDKLLETLDKKNQEVEELSKYKKRIQNKTIVHHLNLHLT